MAKIEETCREVMAKAEWVAILTAGKKGPHLIATWGEFIRKMGITDDLIAIPVGWMHTTKENLKSDKSIELLAASKEVRGKNSLGQGCRIVGTGELQTAGELSRRAKELYPWSRGVLVVRVTETKTLL